MYWPRLSTQSNGRSATACGSKGRLASMPHPLAGNRCPNLLNKQANRPKRPWILRSVLSKQEKSVDNLPRQTLPRRGLTCAGSAR